MVKVYFENLGANGTSNYAELVAIFDSEEMYDVCLPALEKEAKNAGMIITESVEDEIEIYELKEA